MKLQLKFGLLCMFRMWYLFPGIHMPEPLNDYLKEEVRKQGRFYWVNTMKHLKYKRIG